MNRLIDLSTAILAKNDDLAEALRRDLLAGGTVAVNLLSSPGSGKTALLELLLARALARDVSVAALTGDVATENDARRLARSGAPVRQVVTGGLCHLEADLIRDHLTGWLPADTRLLFIENVGNLVCPASYDLGDSVRVVLASVTEGEDKPVKYPAAYHWADVVVMTKVDLAQACDFDESAFLEAVHAIKPSLEVIRTSAKTGEGIDELLTRVIAAAGEGSVVPAGVGATGPC